MLKISTTKFIIRRCHFRDRLRNFLFCPNCRFFRLYVLFVRTYVSYLVTSVIFTSVWFIIHCPFVYFQTGRTFSKLRDFPWFFFSYLETTLTFIISPTSTPDHPRENIKTISISRFTRLLYHQLLIFITVFSSVIR